MKATLAAAVAVAVLALAAGQQGFVLPNEPVPSDTLRIVALGTGTPSEYRTQVSTSYLLQLGSNQNNILFDAGGGSYINLLATQTNLSTVDKVFLSHLHSDHIISLAELYGTDQGRAGPLQVWGPSGQVPSQGTNATIEGLIQFLGWNKASRDHVSIGYYPPGYTGNTVVAHEFQYNVTDQLIYDQNGVQVYSNPAFHYQTPGPVSLKLVWNNITVSYSGDTVPLQTFVDFAEGSNVVIHESVGPVFNLSAANVASRNIFLNHTTQAQVGSVFQALKGPELQLAIATHLTLNDLSYVPIISAIRSTYDGPLSVAKDLDVWDISPTNITQRKYLTPDDIQGGLFNRVTNPAGFQLIDTSVQYPPLPAYTDTGLELFAPALQAPAPSGAPAAPTSG